MTGRLWRRARVSGRLGLALVVSAVLAACMNPFAESDGPGGRSDAPAAQRVNVVVTTGGVSAQSIIPDVAGLVDSYRVTLSRAGHDARIQTAASGPFSFTDIATGTWNVTAEALDAADPPAVVGTGSASLEVSVGGVNSVELRVAPTQTGSGELDLTVTWPGTMIDGFGSATLTPSTGAQIDLQGDADLGADQLTFGRALPSGTYWLSLPLTRDGVPVAPVNAIVHIYDNIVTSQTLALTSEQIGAPPDAPTDLSAQGAVGSVTLTWTDVSVVNDGYEIQRSAAGSADWQDVVTTDGASASYEDTSVAEARSYDYRIRAVNRFGPVGAEAGWVDVGSVPVPRAEPTVRYVATAANGGSDTDGVGTSTAPFATISTAISSLEAVDGETEVRVAAGEYERSAILDIAEGVMVKGGYDPADWDTRDPDVHETVIRSTGSDGKVVQFFATPATPRNGIDGFTIETNRSATSNVIGIYVFQSSPLIRNNVIRAGSSGGPVVYGIRIRVTPSSPVIENNRIELVDGSSAEPTSGFAVQNATNNTEGHILLRSNEIDGGTVEFANRLRLVSNRASGSSMTIENNTITGGVASGDDAYSLYLLNGSNTVRGNTITGPTSAVTRVILAVGEDTVLTGNTLSGGDATASPSESTVLQLSGSNVLVRDNVITLGSGSGRVYGIVAYPDENNIRVDRNTIVAPSADGSQSGVGLWIRERSDIRFSNNLVYRRAGGTRGFTGILSWGASPLVYNNTFVTSNSQGGWTGIQSDSYLSNPSNPDIRNNIFAATVSGLSNATAIVSEDESTQSESTPAVVRSNAFYQLSGLMRIGSSAALTAEADLNDESKTTLRADGTAEGNLVANPAFTDAANEDFSLSASAPASVSSGGSDLSARSIVVDRNGLFRSSDGNGAGYSMGAFESDGVTEGPGPVTNLSAEDGVDQVRLTWTDPSSAFDSVEVSWEPGGSVPEVIDPGIQELVISDLADGSGESEYSFTVQAVTDGGVRSLPRHATATVFDPGSLRWSTETAGKVRSSPAIGGDGTVYIGSNDGSIYALDPDDGSTIWSRGTGNVVFGMPALRADGTVFVGSFSGTLYGFDAADGSDVGSRKLNSGILTSPAIASDGTVYIGAQNGIFYAVEADLAGGSIAWSVDTNMDGVSSKVRSSAAVGADGTVYVASQQTGIAYAIDSSDGSELWSADIGSGILGSPALDSDGTVYIGSGDTDLYALNPSDGSVVWRFETGGAIHASPTVGTGGVVYIGSKDGKFYAVNTSDGSQAWVRSLDDGINSSAALGDNGRLYVGTAAGTVYALEASDGSVAWTYATGNSIWFSSPAIGTDGTVYIGSEDKSVYALRSTAGGLADTAWPRFGGDLLGTRRME